MDGIISFAPTVKFRKHPIKQEDKESREEWIDGKIREIHERTNKVREILKDYKYEIKYESHITW